MAGNENSGNTEKPIDKDNLRKLVGMGCTQEEIAAFIGVSVRTIQRRKESDPEIAEIFEISKLKMNVSLRQWQLDGARKGNSSLLIWLGKIHLGQKEKVELTGKDGAALAAPNLVVTFLGSDPLNK